MMAAKKWIIMLGASALFAAPNAQASPHLRAMAGGSAALTTDPDITELQSAGGLIQAEGEIYGIGKVFGLYARAQHNGMYSSLGFDLADSAGSSLSAIANYERSLLVGPTLGVKAGPIRLRLGVGGAVIESDLSKGTVEEIKSEQAHLIYERATSYGVGGELRLDLNIPIIKPYAVARYLSTTASSTEISGGEYETMSAEQQVELITNVGDRQRLEAVGGVRLSLLPFLQLGLEGTYGLNFSSSVDTYSWYSFGAGLHFEL